MILSEFKVNQKVRIAENDAWIPGDVWIYGIVKSVGLASVIIQWDDLSEPVEHPVNELIDIKLVK